MDFPLKKKVIILLSAVYIIILGVVLVIGLSNKSPQPASLESTLADAQLAAEDTSQTQASSTPERGTGESTLTSTTQTLEETPISSGTTTATRQTTPFPTRTSYQSGTGATATRTPVRTSLSPTATTTTTSAPTITRTSTTIPSPTQTQEPGWQGEWTAFLETSEGVYATGTLIIDVAGTDLTGTGTFDGIAYAFDGALYQNGDIATGSWTTPSDEGNFWWNGTDPGLFSGCSENHWGFCGTRSGSDQPDPCLMKPPS